MSNVTTLLKYSLKTNSAKTLYSDIISKLSNYYYVFGRTKAWPTVTIVSPSTNTTTVISDDENPPSVSDTYSYELETRRDIQYVKIINPQDVCLLANRYDWTLGKIYDQYDEYSEDRLAYSGATQLAFAQFYVLTDELNVYKCLYNNKDNPSSIKPTGTSPYAFTTADGYIWKFLYSVPLSLRNKFLQTKYIPIVTSLNEQFYSNGAIKNYRINEKGSGYINNTWRVKAIKVINGGSGYTTSGTTLEFTNAPIGGTRATATVASVGTNGDVISINITQQGSGYLIQPTLSIVTAPTGAQGAKFLVEYEKTNANGTTEIVISGDGYNEANPYSIKSISITNRGSFAAAESGELFAYDPPNASYGQKPVITVTFREKTGVPGTYEIDTVTLVSGGFGYDTPLVWGTNVISPVLESNGVVLNLNTSTQKNHAKAIPIIDSNGQITAIQITEPGIGYSYATINVVGTKLFTTIDNAIHEMSEDPSSPWYTVGFKKASITVNFSVGNVDSKQSNVELLAVNGSIEVIEVDQGGLGFSSSTTLTVIGDGTGCTCTPVIVNGQLNKIIVTNPGSDYTFASVLVVGSGTQAVIRPIISPKGGHGKDVMEELYASTLMLTTRLVGEKNQGIDITNDFRQIAIIKDIEKYADESYFTSPTGTASAILRFEKTDDNASVFALINQDDTLSLAIDTNKYVTVLEKRTTDSFYELLVSLDTNYLPISNDTIVKAVDALLTYNITVNTVVTPTIDKYSGQMFYIDNRTPFVSNDEQTVVVNTLINL
jgi:hypothetical protein